MFKLSENFIILEYLKNSSVLLFLSCCFMAATMCIPVYIDIHKDCKNIEVQIYLNVKKKNKIMLGHNVQ